MAMYCQGFCSCWVFLPEEQNVHYRAVAIFYLLRAASLFFSLLCCCLPACSDRSIVDVAVLMILCIGDQNATAAAAAHLYHDIPFFSPRQRARARAPAAMMEGR